MTINLLTEPANLARLRQPVSLTAPPYPELRARVPAPGQTPPWDWLVTAIPALGRLAHTPQAPAYHGEGDVWTHTRLVVEAMCGSSDYASATEDRRFVLFYAALLHDIAKPGTTTVDPVSGHIGQPGHSARGAIDARILLWRSGVPFALRESLCRLIRAHQVPFFALHGAHDGKSPEYLVRRLSHAVSMRELTCLAQADMQGRRYAHADDVLLDIELLRTLAQEDGCLDNPRTFSSPQTRMRYFNGADVHPDYAYHATPGSVVTVLSGLPATGKSTWIRAHCQGMPVVGFDEARAALGLKHGDNDGMAAHHAIDQARALLRRQAPFVWNATHLSQQMRAKTLDLLFAYNADVHIVYLEAPEEVLYQRNKTRDTTLANAQITRMLYRWEVVQPFEAHQVSYCVDPASHDTT